MLLGVVVVCIIIVFCVTTRYNIPTTVVVEIGVETVSLKTKLTMMALFFRSCTKEKKMNRRVTTVKRRPKTRPPPFKKRGKERKTEKKKIY